MDQTSTLLEKALKKHTGSEWARMFNITPQTFSMAKREGRLSPVLAGNLAIELGEDAQHWMAVAVLESEKESELLARLRGRVKNWRRLLLSNVTKFTAGLSDQASKRGIRRAQHWTRSRHSARRQHASYSQHQARD